jgi:hypothetical protein
VRAAASARGAGDSAPAAALAALEQLGGSRATPVCVVTLDVTAACLDLPATSRSLPPDRLRELVRWEIEPLVPGAGDLACARSAAGRLTLGIRRHVLDGWRAALAGFRVHALYPRVLGALALLDGHETSIVVEASEDAVATAALREGALESVRVRSLEAPLDAEQLLAFVGAAGVVHFLGERPEHSLALERAGFDVKALEPEAALEGVAAHALGLAPALAAIPAIEPGPPLLARTWARAGLAGLAALGALACADLSTASALRSARVELERLAQRPAPLPLPAPSVAPRAEVVAETARLEADLASAERDRARLEDEVLANDGVPLALLDGLAQATDEDVTLDKVAQTNPGQWRASGFALSDAAVQHFSLSLGRALASRGLKTELLGTRGERGRLGLAGFCFELAIERSSAASVRGRSK